MNKSSFALTGFKYVYLVAFFTLLSGFFYPLITGTSSDGVVTGVFILFFGLGGAVLLYMAAKAPSRKRQAMFLAGGFCLIILSFYSILQIAVRG